MGGGSSSCHGIGCCSKSYHLDPKADKDAKWCANEGGRCSAVGGKAEIYYGWGLTWQRKTLAKGSEIKCGNGAMGCDPLPGTRKYCFKVQDIDPNQQFCCQGDYDITAKSKGTQFPLYDYEGTYGDLAKFDNMAAMKKGIMAVVVDNVPDQFHDTVGMEDIRDQIIEDICDPCANSAHSVSMPHDDIVWTPENMYNLEMPSLFQMDLYLVPIIAFFLLFLSCVQCWSLVRRCTRRVPKKYAVVKRIDYDSEVGTDEAIPMK